MTRFPVAAVRKALLVLAAIATLCFYFLLKQPASAQDLLDVRSDMARPRGGGSLYLPVVMRNFMPPVNLCRFGVGAPPDITRFPVNELRIGWYTDWGTAQHPARPDGIEYLQMVRLAQTGLDSYTSRPQGSDLLATVAANPGARWVIGNEPDRRTWQDSLEPRIYARAYHDLYYQIKTADPTARIVAGSIVQPTPLRLQYLDMVLDSYRAAYGQAMPVDIWNIHAFILNERSCTYFPEDCWGADIPPGINVPEGKRYSVEDNDNLAIFKQYIVDFRQWMADRGYQERPLIITEYGVLMPQKYGFPPARVNAYMNATFAYLSSASGPTGYTADKGRLVQGWAWYSLTDQLFNGWLFDAQTGARTVYGDNFAAYTAAVSPAVNLTPVRLWAEPDTSASPGQAIKLVAQVANSGNVAVPSGTQVRFYDGDPARGGAPIGSDQLLPAMNGCGSTAQATVTWNDAAQGLKTVWVVVDPLLTVAESDETDNRLMATVTVGP